MLIIKWISQHGPWVLLFNTHKSLHHLLMEYASGYTSYPDLGKPKFRAHKAFFASQSLRVECRVHKECCMKGTTLFFHLELDRTITPSPSLFWPWREILNTVSGCFVYGPDSWWVPDFLIHGEVITPFIS